MRDSRHFIVRTPKEKNAIEGTFRYGRLRFRPEDEAEEQQPRELLLYDAGKLDNKIARKRRKAGMDR